MSGMHWCARTSRGDKLLDRVYPYIFHLTRSVCHKPHYVTIALQQCCVAAALHPKIRKVVEAFLSVSILGRKGSNVACDRLVEWINQYQQQRGGMGGDFDKKLHTGPALVPMLHVTHVRRIAHPLTSTWHHPDPRMQRSYCACASHTHMAARDLSQAFDDLHDSSPGGASEPIRASLLNGARKLQDKLTKALGTDLTVQNELNPFWFTGNSCNMACVGDRDLLRKKPWEYMWKVAAGTSGGKGAPGGFGLRKVERWQKLVERKTYGDSAHMWPIG